MTRPHFSPVAGSRRKAALVFIFFTVLIDALSFGVVIPVLPHLVEQLAGGDTSTAAYWIGVFGFTYALIQFFAAPMLGALSDRFGRRPVILISCLGLCIDFVIMALAPNLAWLLVGRMLSAVMSASFSTANAYIADVVEPQQRAKSFGMMGAAFGVGFIFGPLLGGPAQAWLGITDLRVPFWISAGLAGLNFLYGMFVLPESLAPHNRSKRFEWKHANPLGSARLLLAYPQLFGLAAVILLANLAHYVYPSIFVLFVDYRFGWGQSKVGFVLAASSVLMAIVNGILVGKLVKHLGERRALLFGLVAGTLGFALYGLAGSGALFLMGLPISALWALAGPSAQALITRQVGPEVQGRVQGAVSSLVSLAGIFAPAIYAGSFGYFIGEGAPLRLPGVPFLIAAGFLGLGVLVAWRYARVPTESLP